MSDTKKVLECPECGSDNLYDRWVAGRKLQQGCSDCEWRGISRTPDTRPIKTTKVVQVNQFHGFCFEVYDQYGHTLIHSKSYDSHLGAKEALDETLAKLNKNPNYAPCTGVLWPDQVEVKGEVIT